jgi:hypothetical protein
MTWRSQVNCQVYIYKWVETLVWFWGKTIMAHRSSNDVLSLSLSPSSFLWDYFFPPSLSLSVGRMTTIIINALFFYIVEKAMKEITSMILVDTVPLRLSSSLSSVCAIALIHSGDNNSSRHNSRADNNR